MAQAVISTQFAQVDASEECDDLKDAVATSCAAGNNECFGEMD